MSEIRGAGGGKGGRKPRQPVEQRDSLHSRSYAKVLDLLCEGECYGPATGILEQCVYFDGTPVQNSDGSMNFLDVEMDYRVGTQAQDHMPGFPSIESTIGVGVELSFGSPFVQSISNTQLSAVRVMISTPSLMSVNEENGDRNGYRVEYFIQISTDGGPYQLAVSSAFDGKTTTGYSRSHRIELPPATLGWNFRVTRSTPNSTSSAIQDSTFIESYTEIIDAKLRYPMSSMVGTKINAEQFSSVPSRAYDWGGLFIKIPSNYNPVTRQYTGVWDGQFTVGFSNNPAWVLYDIITQDRYGLGDMLGAANLNRYALYQIGYYCDQMVSDGEGGMEPRFTCNVYLQSKAEALKVIQDLAAVFRGIAYWAADQVQISSDMPTDPVYMFTNAKVKDGRFEYTGTPRHNRKTVALVSWVDVNDFSKAKVEVVENHQGIERYGIKKISVTPLGCTSRSQAQRIGNYLLLTSLMETGGVGFTVGMEGVIPAPGSIIRVADKHLAGRSLGGLIVSATANTVTIDRDSPIAPGGQLSVILPNATMIQRTVLSVAGRVVTISGTFGTIPEAQSQWFVDATDLVAQYYRVLSVKEDGIEFQIQAVQHHPGKFSAIDDGTLLEPLPVSVVPSRVQAPPENLQIVGFNVISQGITRANATISWDAAEGAVQYEVEWRRNNNEWVRSGRTGSLSLELRDIFAGDYEARVRAINSADIPSLWENSAVTTLDGLVGEPPALLSLTTTPQIMAIELGWTYPPGRNIIERVQIRSSMTVNFEDSTLLTDLAYPANRYTLYGLGYDTEMWFWGRLIDRNGQASPWFPSESGNGVHGQTDQNPENILEYLEGQINESHLAPDLIEEIESGTAEGVIEEIIGNLTGDTDADGIWYAGDDEEEGTFVGTVTYTSMVNAGDYRLSKQVFAMAARVDESAAAIRQEQIVRAAADSALASQQLNLSAQINGMAADVQEAYETSVELDGSIRSTYQLKLQARSDGRIVQTGVAMGASIGADGSPRSEMIWMADTIAFATQLNGALHTPFVFDVANDTVFLANAMIQNGSITNAKIGNVIQSDNFVANTSGWQINKSGTIQINGVGGAGRMIIDATSIRVYDGANTLRVRMGLW